MSSYAADVLTVGSTVTSCSSLRLPLLLPFWSCNRCKSVLGVQLPVAGWPRGDREGSHLILRVLQGAQVRTANQHGRVCLRITGI